jgi:geranylgeranyl pyrophosphate synthase
VVRNGGATTADIERFQSLCELVGAVEAARAIAAEYAARAVESLGPLSDSQFRDSLEQLAHFLLRRES